MKFGQFMSYYKKKIKIFANTGIWKLIPGSFLFAKN